MGAVLGRSAAFARNPRGRILLRYGVAGLDAVVANLAVLGIGIPPGYWINRSWVWGRHGHSNLRRELAPFVIVILVTAAFSTAFAAGADAVATAVATSRPTQTVV